MNPLRPCGCPENAWHRAFNPACPRVRVTQGRWEGRVGVQVDQHVNRGTPGGQQMQFFPVVALDPAGRAESRTVRVLAVEPVR